MDNTTLRTTLSGWARWGVIVGLALAQSACPKPKEPTLDMRLINSSVLRPSNVAVYFSVETPEGAPVANLSAKSFRIYEDDQLISPYESKQTILNPQVAVSHHVILLLDLSGSIVESGSLSSLIQAANSFVGRVAKQREIAVYGFDGRKRLIPVAGFTKDQERVRTALEELRDHKVKDPSTNLNGAVVNAINELEKQIGRSRRPLRFATLVVFTDGTDRAHRVTAEELYKVLEKSPVNVFVAGLGGEIDESQLSSLGRSGFVKAEDRENIAAAFEQIANRIEASGQKFYLLSYCSPARAGQHQLRVEVTYEGLRGSLTHEFDADGFRPGCDPNRKPRFSLKRIRLRAK
jgi:hypothetical protein